MIHVYTVRDVLPWHTLEAEIPEMSIDPQSILCYQMGKVPILCWGNDESNLCFERVLMIHHQFISKIIKLYPHHVLSSWRMSWSLQSSNLNDDKARKFMRPGSILSACRSMPNCLYKPFYLRGCWHPQQCPLHSSGPSNTTKKNLTHLFAVAVFGIKIPAVFGRIWVHIPEKWDVLMFHKAGVIATSKQFRSQNCCTLLT